MNESHTVDQWLTYWLSQQEKKNLKKVTVNSYQNIVNRHLIPSFQNVDLGTLSASDIEKVYKKWQKKGMPYNTVNTIHIAFKRCLQDACREEIIQSNLAMHCLKKKVQRNDALPTARQCYQYLNTVKQQPEYPLLYLALTTDLSQEKIFSLRWVDFDIAHKQMMVGNRIRRLNDKCVELLKQQYRLTGGQEWMFLNPKRNKIYNRAQFYYIHTKILRLAGMPQIPFGLLRKRFREVEV